METTNNQMQVIVKEKSVYGNILVYPANEKAQIFANLIGKKTFTDFDLKCIKSLGFEVELISLP